MNGIRRPSPWLWIAGPPVLLILTCVTMAYREYASRRDVLDYLKLAADAPNLALAERYLSTAVHNMEARRWTAGSTALIFKAPRRDIGFWYQNTRGALDEVKTLIATSAELTPVDRSNALVKLRETLMDGIALTYPEWIELAPHNAFFFWVTLLSAVASLNSFLVLFARIVRWARVTPVIYLNETWLHAAWHGSTAKPRLLDHCVPAGTEHLDSSMQRGTDQTA